MSNETATIEYDFPDHRFEPFDYVVFGIMLSLSSVIGLYFGCTARYKPQTTADYLMAGRSMGILPVSLSLLASFMSAITLLGQYADLT